MADNALALIQAKIVEVEGRLAKLRVTEAELSKLLGSSAKPAARRGRPPKTTEAGKPKSVAVLVREALSASDGLTASQIAEAVAATTKRDIDPRAVSFTLQAFKRRGEARSRDRIWSLVRRRRQG